MRAAAGATPLPLPEVTTAPIRAAWRRMTALLEEAAGGAEAVCAGEDWTARARRAMDAVVRKSVEMRLVAGLVAD